MTEYQYSHLLDPDLYHTSRCARFVETLLSPEIESRSEQDLENFVTHVAPTDDSPAFVDEIIKIAELSIKQTGHFKPFFAIFRDDKSLLTLSFTFPSNRSQIQEMMAAGKCFAFAMGAQASFLATEIFHNGREPIFGKLPHADSSWGIYITGSTVRGNSLDCLINVTEEDHQLRFAEVNRSIKIDGQQNRDLQGFYQINNEEEMSRILFRLPQIIQSYKTDAMQCIRNFAMMLKALRVLGYHR